MFRLFDLPFLARQHVFSVMDPTEQFSVALHFPWLKTYFPKTKPPSGLNLKYIDLQFCLFKETQNGELFPLMKYEDSATRPGEEKKILWSYGNKKISVRFIYTTYPATMIVSPGFRNFLFSILLENFVSVFGEPAFHNVSVNEGFNPFPNLGTIRKLEIAMPFDVRSQARLHRALQSFNTTPEIIDVQPDVTCTLPDSFLAIDTLVIRDHGDVLLRDTAPFTGRHIIVASSSYSGTIVNGWLKDWMEGRGMWATAESCMLLHNDGMEVGEVLGGLPTQRYRPGRRPARYVSTCKYHLPSADEIFDCTNAFDIQRESDGRLASIKITDYQLFFFVWPN